MGAFLGIGGPYHHDASACVVDGEGQILAFAEEERFTRVKSNRNSRSAGLAASWCLEQAGISVHDLEAVAIAFNPSWPKAADTSVDPDLIEELLPPRHVGGRVAEVHIVDHHLAHAASSFYASGFEESAVMVVDGSGDGYSTTFWRGTGASLTLIRSLGYQDSLGWFFESVTEYLGLGDFSNAGKLMGLAAYGTPRFELPFLDRRPGDGSPYRLSLGGDWSDEGYVNLADYRRIKRDIKAHLSKTGVPGCGKLGDHFLPAHADLAASAQSALSEALVTAARFAMDAANCVNLCVAGGVGFNCSANGEIWRKAQPRQFFVQPVAGDAGCSLGAALALRQRLSPGGQHRSTVLPAGLACGPSYSDASIYGFLREMGVPHLELGDEVVPAAADRMVEGYAVAWFQGPAEVGPRSLGHRSIVANAGIPELREVLNSKVKRREAWRPFAPSILRSERSRLVEQDGPDQFMVVAHHASEQARLEIPAAIHVDGSIRPQVVDDIDDHRFARLLRAVRDLTGTGAVLNTSFNDEREPIVLSPRDAVRTFYGSSLEVMALGGALLEKRSTRRAGGQRGFRSA
jgi:carbamoyltransferase